MTTPPETTTGRQPAEERKMMIYKRLTGVLGALALAGGIVAALAAPAAAHHNVPDITTVKGDCGVVTLTAAWTLDTHTVGNAALVVKVGDEIATAAIGEQLTVGPFAAPWTEVRYRVWGGGERDYDVPAQPQALIDHVVGGGSPFDVDAPAKWRKIRVPGCPTESTVTFTPDCDGTAVTVSSGMFLHSYDWTATWADGDESTSLTVDAGTSAELATVPADGGEITVDFAGSPAGWPQTYTWGEADVEQDCTEASPSPSPSVSPTPGVPVTGGGDEASADQLPLTGSSAPAFAVTGVLLIGSGGLAVWAARQRKGPLITLPTE